MNIQFEPAKQSGKAFLFLFLIVCLSSCSGYKPAYLTLRDAEGKKIYPERKDFFKEYALCSCLLMADSEKMKDNQDASRAFYINLSDDDLMINETARKIDSNAVQFINSGKSSYGSRYEGRQTPVSDCIGYYKSKELDRFIETVLTDLKKYKRSQTRQ
ncbi:MAG: hypothetical protein JNM88_19960 [Chitinophagaceae bacterium]|nr:hypothetical protein [Chitinophagaceae bacterium]